MTFTKTLKTFIAMPFYFLKTTQKHCEEGPPLPSWSLPMHLTVSCLRRLLETHKSNIKTARLLTKGGAPVGIDTARKPVQFRRRRFDDLIEVVYGKKALKKWNKEQESGGWVKGEWLEHKHHVKKHRKWHLSQRNSQAQPEQSQQPQQLQRTSVSSETSSIYTSGQDSHEMSSTTGDSIQSSQPKPSICSSQPTSQDSSAPSTLSSSSNDAYSTAHGPTFASEKVILYLHGGAHIVCHPGTHRPIMSRLSKYSHCRILAIKYRKAPEFPYPCALVDVLSAYEYLLTIGWNPQQILLAGDSAGGNLCISLCLYLRMNRPNWKDLVPGGLVLFSPWVDLTHSMPSYKTNGPYDYLPSEVGDPLHLPRTCETTGEWYKSQYYAPEIKLRHPLVSPLFADEKIVKEVFGSGRVATWIAIGGVERLRDEGIAWWGKTWGWQPKLNDELDGKTDVTTADREDVHQSGTYAQENAILHSDLFLSAPPKAPTNANSHITIYKDLPHVPPLFFMNPLGKACLKSAGAWIRCLDHRSCEAVSTQPTNTTIQNNTSDSKSETHPKPKFRINREPTDITVDSDVEDKDHKDDDVHIYGITKERLEELKKKGIHLPNGGVTMSFMSEVGKDPVAVTF